MRAQKWSRGDQVLASAVVADDATGVLWVVAANETDDRGGPAVCREADAFIRRNNPACGNLAALAHSLDLYLRDDVTPRLMLGGLAASVLLARITSALVEIAFVGEARAHVFHNGDAIFGTREHSVYYTVPEALWTARGYTEQRAKSTILRVAGSGNAVIESHLLPRRDPGALVALTHTWHKYRSPEVYTTSLEQLFSNADKFDVDDGQAVALLRW